MDFFTSLSRHVRILAVLKLIELPLIPHRRNNMTNQTQNRHTKANANTAERAFFYNIILSDVAVLIIGLTTSFGALLCLFS